MKIVVITGSHNRKGTSALLADEFIKGAQTKGHEVFRFDAAFKNVHPCIGCLTCRRGEADCIFKDDMYELYPKIIEADVIACVTPLYYHSYTAQLKTVIDRYYAKDKFLCGAKKKAILIVTGANPNEWVTNGITTTFDTSLKYLNWKDAGKILAINCATIDKIKNTNFPELAYKLGLSLES